MTEELVILPALVLREKKERVNVSDIFIDGMRFRIFVRPDISDITPCLIYYHGGCFVSGGFETHDNQLRQLAYYSGCRVIAVQYRLAPEFLFPVAHDDGLC